ncbi:class I SAM-dependent DNA methyltransferase [Thalassospira mesophila]|uniref:Methyltransferase type 11 n=1 Tax=Thalassospira mesophila TaxID=1293891 RepID=A0A1Y2L4Y4_9PROT|nr:methyltransferase domain-containing protein [Thalassospira mesophila]OSQ40887.1 methyltransferase type 11 [Thalassospira mesophila]
MSNDRLSASRRLDVALAMASRGDSDAAIEVAQAAIEADSDWDEAYFVLGEMLEKAGQKEAAIDAYRACLKRDATDRMGAEVRLMLLGAIAVRDRLPPDYVRALFDDYAPRFDVSLRDKLAYRAPELMFEAVRVLIADMAHPREVLDLGCGTGLVADVFAGQVDVLDGVDLSPRMLNRARAKGLYRQLLAADITSMPDMVTARYGLVVAADVLNYLGDLEPVLAMIHSRLLPGGILVMSLEEGEIYPFDLGPGQRFRHHPDVIAAWLKRADLEVVSDVPGVLRQEKGISVTGRIVVARAVTAIASLSVLPGTLGSAPDGDLVAPETVH